jgi:hypothetical protein
MVGSQEAAAGTRRQGHNSRARNLRTRAECRACVRVPRGNTPEIRLRSAVQKAREARTRGASTVR